MKPTDILKEEHNMMADQNFMRTEQTQLLGRFQQVETAGAACSAKRDLFSMLEQLEQFA